MKEKLASNSACTSTNILVSNNNTPQIETKFYVEYKDYIVFIVNLIIAFLAFCISRSLSKKDKIKEADYQAKLYLYQNIVIPFHGKLVELINKTSMWQSEVLARFNNRSIIPFSQTTITSIEQDFEKFNSLELNSLDIYDANLKKFFIEEIENLQDLTTRTLTNIASSKNVSELQKNLQLFAIEKNIFLDKVNTKVANSQPLSLNFK